MKKKKKGVDRRRAERLPIKMKVCYKAPRSKTPWKDASCKDISGVGIGLLLNEPLKANSKVEMMLYSNDDSKPIWVSCKVVWCGQAPRHKYRAGVEIVKVKEMTRFVNFICTQLMSNSTIACADVVGKK